MNSKLMLFLAPGVSPAISFMCIFLIANTAADKEILDFYTSLALSQLLFTLFIWGNGSLLYRHFFTSSYQVELAAATHLAISFLICLLIVNFLGNFNATLEVLAAFMLCLHRLLSIHLRLHEQGTRLLALETANALLLPLLIYLFHLLNVDLIYILPLKHLVPCLLLIAMLNIFIHFPTYIRDFFHIHSKSLRQGANIFIGSLFNRASRYLDRKLFVIVPFISSPSSQMLSLQVASVTLFLISIFGDYLSPSIQRVHSSGRSSKQIFYFLLYLIIAIISLVTGLLFLLHSTIENLSLIDTPPKFWTSFYLYGFAFSLYTVNVVLNPLLVAFGKLRVIMVYHIFNLLTYIIVVMIILTKFDFYGVELSLSLFIASAIVNLSFIGATFLLVLQQPVCNQPGPKLTLRDFI